MLCSTWRRKSLRNISKGVRRFGSSACSRGNDCCRFQSAGSCSENVVEAKVCAQIDAPQIEALCASRRTLCQRTGAAFSFGLDAGAKAAPFPRELTIAGERSIMPDACCG
jgi:hypothetical protein